MNKILFKLLLLDGNETALIQNGETYQHFKSLIVEVAKANNDIRYCSNHNCKCHPESAIKSLLKNKELVSFLNEFAKGLVEDLTELCETYSPVVAKGIYED